MPSGRTREFSSVDMIQALLETRTAQDAADLLACSAPAIAARAKLDVQVKIAMREQKERLEDEMAECILRHRGILTKVAGELGLKNVQNVHYRIRQSRVLQEVLEEARYRVVDKAEDNVFTQVEAGDYGASVFVLKNLGKDRGYTEKREIESNVVHTLDEASTANLVQLLDQQASSNPEAVEAEFEVLGEEDKGLLQEALDELRAGEEEDLVELEPELADAARETVEEQSAKAVEVAE